MNHSCHCDTPCDEFVESAFMTAYDSIQELQCPLQYSFDCERWMNREELAVHLGTHPGENQDPEWYWNYEAERRLEQGYKYFQERSA